MGRDGKIKRAREEHSGNEGKKQGPSQLPRLVCRHCGNVFRMVVRHHYVCDTCVQKAMTNHGFVFKEYVGNRNG